MPKMKTNRGAAKRFNVTAKGKIKSKIAYARHILTTKSSKRKRKMRGTELVNSRDLPRVRKLIPYK